MREILEDSGDKTEVLAANSINTFLLSPGDEVREHSLSLGQVVTLGFAESSQVSEVVSLIGDVKAILNVRS